MEVKKESNISTKYSKKKNPKLSTISSPPLEQHIRIPWGRAGCCGHLL
jgi:hypothetical protein